MTKNGKITIVLGVAVMFAILAGVLLYIFMSPHRTTVYVFNDTYRAGTELNSAMLTPVKADSTIIVAGQNTGADSQFISEEQLASILRVGNESLRVGVSSGTPLMAGMLSSTGGNEIEAIMSPSNIAVTVNVDGVSGVTDELETECHVNVYVVGASNGTYLLLENKRVIATSKSASGTLASATLELNHEEAVSLIAAQRSAKIYFGLVRDSGYQYIKDVDKNSLPDDTSLEPGIPVNPETAPAAEEITTEATSESTETTTETTAETTAKATEAAVPSGVSPEDINPETVAAAPEASPSN